MTNPDIYEFYNLGLGDPIAVSAVHGHGTGDLLDACFAHFPPEEEEEEDLTGDALAEMDFEELEEVCDDKDLDTDPDDFDEDEIEKLRKAIAKELGLKLPAKKEAKGKGKKGKK